MTKGVVIGLIVAGLALWGLLFVAARAVPLEAVPLVLGIFTAVAALVAIITWGLSPKGEARGRDET